MLVTRYGARECIMVSSLCAIVAALVIVSIGPLNFFAAMTAVGLLFLIWLALMLFFRDPIRRLPADLREGDMIAPADGTVSAVETRNWHEATDGPVVIVRIFLSLLNVHVNRSPFDGEVVSLKYRPGRFLNAQTEESAKVNESNLITMRIGDAGETIGVRQVSGMLARRIVCPLSPGDRLRRGQKFGMIKFGSTTELILPRPDEVEVHVKRGDKVRGGRTILATIRPLKATTKVGKSGVMKAPPVRAAGPEV